MKRLSSFAMMLVLVAAPAFGGTKPQTVVIPDKVTVGTTVVPAGTYKLTWSGSGPSVQATLTQERKTIVTFSAKEVVGKSSPGVETYSRGGVSTLQTIHMDKVSLELEGAAQAGQ